VSSLCLLAGLRVFFFSTVFPFFNNVDEQSHVDLVHKYARGHLSRAAAEPFDREAAALIATYASFEYLGRPADFPRGFPRPLWERPPDAARRTFERRLARLEARTNYEAHSPPVYYAVAGAWLNLGRALGLEEGTRLYWLRWLDVVLAVLLVASAYAFCRIGCPGRAELRLGVPLVLAFLPQDAFWSVTNDALSPVLASIGLTALLLTWRRAIPGAGHAAAVGALAAAALLVKYTNLPLAIVLGGGVLAVSLRQWRAGRAVRAATLLAVGSAALLVPVAAWLGRNYALLGDFTGTRTTMQHLGWSPRPLGDLFSHPIFSPEGLWIFWSGLLETFWRGEHVWHLERIAHPAMDAFYVLSSTVAVVLAAACGLGAGRGRRSRVRRDDARLPGDVALLSWTTSILYVLCLVGLSVAFEFGSRFTPTDDHPYFSMGRMISGSVLPFALLYVSGIAFLWPARLRVRMTLVVLVAICVAVTIGEVWLSLPAMRSPFNWYHL
jgi:hypothetical protein